MATPALESAAPSRRPRSVLRRASLAATLLLLGALPAGGQSLDDAALVPRRELRTTVEYANEWWDHYWEGERRRDNENIGTLTTQSVTWSAAYGVTERVTLVASIPYVWTSASRGVLHDMRGWQDVTLAAKVRLLRTTVGERTGLDVSALGGVGVPASDYTPDFLPLSIGLASRRAMLRGALHLRGSEGWFAGGAVGRTWRSTVRLDRDAYYTDGELVLGSEVAMPDVLDYGVVAGWAHGRFTVPVGLAVQRTLGGGDIRRQDMPFVSNRMDFTRVHGRVTYALPRLDGLAVHLGAMHTLGGRNVGESTSISGGLTSAFRL